MLSLVPVPVPERQPVACPSCTRRLQYRANAAAHFAIFEARFGTSGVSRRQLRAVFAAHADPQLVETLLVFAWHKRLPAWRLREITKSLTPRRSPNRKSCWLHDNAAERPASSTTGHVAAFDAKGVVHVTD